MAPDRIDFRRLDFSRRAQLTELMDEPRSREELRACLQDLARVNRWLMGYRPTLRWLDSLPQRQSSQPIRILDVGCGYGDTLRRIERWSGKRGIAVQLTGLDLNPDTTAIAAEASGAASQIEWVTANVFAYAPPFKPHIVLSSLFTHHLADGEVRKFLRWMEQNAEVGWFINDLSRAPIPYHLFRWFSRLMRLHPFVQHDGPVSIARAFTADDWRKLCAAAGLDKNQYELQAYKPGRLCVSRRKSSRA